MQGRGRSSESTAEHVWGGAGSQPATGPKALEQGGHSLAELPLSGTSPSPGAAQAARRRPVLHRRLQFWG